MSLPKTRSYQTNKAYENIKTGYDCPECKKTFLQYSSLKRHLQTHAPGYVSEKRAVVGENTSQTFVCDLCGKSYVHKNSLLRHIQKHKKADYTCSGCSKVHSEYTKHYNHRRKCERYHELQSKRKSKRNVENAKPWIKTTGEYMSVYQHKCQMCEERFAIREHLDSHVEHCGDPFWSEKVNEPGKLLLDELERTAVSKRRKHIFLQIAKQSNRQKSTCNKQKAVMSSRRIKQIYKAKKLFPLSSIIVTARLVKRKYQCRLSETLFGTCKGGRKAHWRNLRRKTLKGMLKYKENLQNSSWYECKLCAGTYKSRYTFINHLKSVVHKLQRPILCQVCLKDFSSIQSFRFYHIAYSHRTNMKTLIIRYAKLVPADRTLKSDNGYANDNVILTSSKHTEITAQQADKKFETKSTDTYLLGKYDGKCLCGVIFDSMEHLVSHVQKVHGLIQAFKCSHCLRDNIFIKPSDLFKHLTLQHKIDRVGQSDFEEKILSPVDGENSNLAKQVLNELSVIPSSEVIRHTVEVATAGKKAEVAEFLELSLNTVSGEKVSKIVKSQSTDKKHDIKNINRRGYASDLLIEKGFLNPKGRLAWNRKMEKFRNISGKLSAAIILKKYKKLSGWKYRKDFVHLARQQKKRKKSRLIFKEKNHHDIKYKCSICQKVFSNAQTIISHLSKVHKKPSVLECSVCKKTFHDLISLSTHHYQHSDAKTDIQINVLHTMLIEAGEQSQTKLSEKRNKETVRLLRGTYPNQCHLCKNKFPNRATLAYHVRLSHHLILGYRCKLCDKNIAFEKFSQFYEHLKKIHIKINFEKSNFEQVSVVKLNVNRQTKKADTRISNEYNTGSQQMRTSLVTCAEGQLGSSQSERDSKLAKYPTVTESRGKRQIKPKFDSAFEYGSETAQCHKRRKLGKTPSNNRDHNVKATNEVKMLMNSSEIRDKNTKSTVENSCRYCGKEFRFKSMLQKHVERMHTKKAHGEIENIELESTLKELKVKVNDISKIVSQSERAVIVKSFNKKSQPQRQNDETSPVNLLKVNGCNNSRRAVSSSDHNYVAKTVNLLRKQSSEVKEHWLCEFCEYYSEKAVNLKKHMAAKHKITLPKNSSKIEYVIDNCQNPDVDIYSGDSDQSDMAGIKTEFGYNVECKLLDDNEIKTGKNRGKGEHITEDVKKKCLPLKMQGLGNDIHAFYMCSLKKCNKLFSTKNLLSDHKKETHFKELVYVCNVCHKEFYSVLPFKRHMTTSHMDFKKVPFKIAEAEICTSDLQPIEVVICTVCGFIGNNEKVHDHICRAKPVNCQYYCPFCNMKKCSTKYEEIRVHIEKKHLDQREKKFTNQISVDGISDFQSLETAINEPVSYIWSCSTAGGDDTTLSEATTDAGDATWSSQSGEEGRADELPQTNSTASSGTGTSLKSSGDGECGDEQGKSLLQMTGSQKTPADSQKDNMIPVTFDCRVCKRQFETEFHLNIHKLGHTGHTIKPYVCGLCGISYPRYPHLRRHMLVHKESGGFKCELCCRHFSVQSDLDRHSRTHADVKPYQCGICSNRYCDYKSCKSHIKAKHPDISDIEKEILKMTRTVLENNVENRATLISEAAVTSTSIKSGQGRHDVSDDLGKGREISSKIDSTKREQVSTGGKRSSGNSKNVSSEISVKDIQIVNSSKKSLRMVDQTTGGVKQIQAKKGNLITFWQCEYCDYYSTRSSNMRRHRLTHNAGRSSEHNKVKHKDKKADFHTSNIRGSDAKRNAIRENVLEGNDGEIKSTSKKDAVNKALPMNKVIALGEVDGLTDEDDEDSNNKAEKPVNVDRDSSSDSHIGNTRNIEEKQRHLEPFDGTLNVLYKCTFENCDKFFHSQKGIKLHRKTDHNKSMIYICPCCHNEYSLIRSLKIHINQSHGNIRRIPLTIADTELYTKGGLKDYKSKYKKEKNIQEVLICCTCGTSGTTESLDRHRCQPKVPTFYCPCCSKEIMSSTDSEAVREHIRQQHMKGRGTWSAESGVDEEFDLSSAGPEPQPMQMSEPLSLVESSQAAPQEQNKGREELEMIPCVHCQQCFSTEFDKNMHELQHTGLKLQSYVCGLCGISYPRLAALKKHAMCHREYKHKCDQCDRAFQEKADLDRHANTHSGNRPYQCDICGNRYCDDKACKRHMKDKHPNTYYERFGQTTGKPLDESQQNYVCEHCGEIFKNTRHWNYHTINSHGLRKKRLACSVCPDKTFRTKKLLDRHTQQHKHTELLEVKAKENTQHLDPKLQLHEKVKVAVKDLDSLRQIYHELRIVDNSDKDGLKYMCRVCSKKFRKVKSLNLHIRGCHTDDENKKFRCTICSKGFVIFNSLKNHMRIHTQSRPYQCQLCSKSFKQVAHVKDHLLSHSTKFTTNCQICGKVFKLNGSIKPHIITHCKLKPFKCPVCPETFQDVTQLIDHFSNIDHKQCEKQDALKSFTCHMCLEFQTDRKWDMIKHLENHTIDMPFNCEKCDEKYCKYLDLYFHKTKFNHFVKSDFDSVKKTSNPCLGNFGKVEIFDSYDLEELQSKFVYKPDSSELSRQELEDMVNPDGIGDYDDNYPCKKMKRKPQIKVPDGRKTFVTSIDLSDLEYRVNNTELSQPNTGIEYEEDLLSVAEQLTHMADIEQTGYTEIVIPASIEDGTSDVNRATSKTFSVTVENNDSPMPPIDQLPLEGNFDIGLPWNTHLFLKGHNQKGIPLQDQFKKFQPGIQTDVIHKVTYSHERYQEAPKATNPPVNENMKTVLPGSAASALLQENVKSVMHGLGSNLTNNKEGPVSQSDPQLVMTSSETSLQQDYTNIQTSIQTTKAVVKDTFNVVDQSGNEIIVYILNDTGENTDLNTIVQNAENRNSEQLVQEIVAAPDLGEIELNTAFSRASENDKRSVPYLPEYQVEVETVEYEKPPDTSVTQINMGQVAKTSNINMKDTHNVKTQMVQAKVSDSGVKEIFEKECFYLVSEAKQVNKQLQTTDDDDDDEKDVLKRKTKYFHKNNEDTGNFPCEVCGKRFQSVKLKNTHKKVHLPDHLRKFRCDLCGKGFNRPKALEIHFQSHTGTKMFHCKICDKRFTQLGHLTTHQLVHTEDKPFKCSQCKWTGTTKSNLRRHILDFHGGEKKWKCGRCDKAFVRKNELKRHSVYHLSKSARSEIIAKTSVIRANGKDGSPETELETSGKKSKTSVPKYVCDICGMGYMNIMSLNKHKMRHESGEDFKCKECGKGFPSEEILREHEKSHENCIPCDRCGKMLKTRASLKYHLSSVHDQIKKYNYTCIKCKKGFIRETHFLCHVAVCDFKETGSQ